MSKIYKKVIIKRDRFYAKMIRDAIEYFEELDEMEMAGKEIVIIIQEDEKNN